MKKIITKSEEETFVFAQNFAKGLKGGEVIGLEGDLGAGKTIFSKGLAAGLGIKKNITSPTFVVMKIYEVPNHPTIRTLCHIDAYKIGDADVEAFGMYEYLGKTDTVVIVEWINNVKNVKSFLSHNLSINEFLNNSRKLCMNLL